MRRQVEGIDKKSRSENIWQLKPYNNGETKQLISWHQSANRNLLLFFSCLIGILWYKKFYGYWLQFQQKQDVYIVFDQSTYLATATKIFVSGTGGVPSRNHSSLDFRFYLSLLFEEGTTIIP